MKRRCRLRRDLQRHACLPDAADPGQGDHAPVPEQPDHLVELVASTDERAHCGGKVAREPSPGLEGREVSGQA